MNTVEDGDRALPPDPATWEARAVRLALAVRDIRAVYRLLQGLGYSQQRIGALTRMSQPEVSAVLAGRRVMAYGTLERIADGLGIPRRYLGLGYGGGPDGR